jgi:hypothetical protein
MNEQNETYIPDNYIQVTNSLGEDLTNGGKLTKNLRNQDENYLTIDAQAPVNMSFTMNATTLSLVKLLTESSNKNIAYQLILDYANTEEPEVYTDVVRIKKSFLKEMILFPIVRDTDKSNLILF